MCATGAIPMGAPLSQERTRQKIQPEAQPESRARRYIGFALTGCPLLAFPTTSAARIRMVLMPISSEGWGEKLAIVRKDI